MAPQELFERNQRWAEGIARKFRRRLPPSFEICDLTQAALWALWQAAERWDESYSVPFQQYAYRYVLNACRMQVRRREWTERTMEELPVRMVAPDRDRPDRQAVLHDASERLFREVEELPRAHRKVLEGLYWQSKSLLRMAQQMRTSAAAIAKTRDEAIELLRADRARRLRQAELRRKRVINIEEGL